MMTTYKEIVKKPAKDMKKVKIKRIKTPRPPAPVLLGLRLQEEDPE